MPFQRGAFELTGSDLALQLQNADDLPDRPLRDLPFQLDGFLKQTVKVLRQPGGKGVFSGSGFQTGKTLLCKRFLITVQGANRYIFPLGNITPYFDFLCRIQIFLEQRSDKPIPAQGFRLLPVKC